MLARYACAVATLTMLFTPRVVCRPDTLSGPGIVAVVTASLQKLTQLQGEIADIHPYLQHLHPVAVVEGDSLFIFDVDSTQHAYSFRTKLPAPFPMPRGIRASFPLESYGGKPTCVVSREVFDSMKGYATIFHEFVHCTQFLTCENELKEGLSITRAAAQARNYSWEINHPFPYEDPGFVRDFSGFLQALAGQDTGDIRRARRSLEHHLSAVDHDYLTWVMWKEGFARFIENEIRARYGLEANHGGKDQPYNRVAFYFGGEQFIRHLIRNAQGRPVDVRQLFSQMR